MHVDLANCILHCLVYQQDKPPMLPKEELRWMDKDGAPFIGWSINVVSSFPWDEYGNHYPLFAIYLFSKWVET